MLDTNLNHAESHEQIDELLKNNTNVMVAVEEWDRCVFPFIISWRN